MPKDKYDDPNKSPDDGESGQDDLTPEQMLANAQAALEKEKADRVELQKKVSEMGEELSQKTAALDGYRRGDATPAPVKPDKTPVKLPDPIEDPEGYAQAVINAATQNALGYINAQNAAYKNREDFFKAYPALRKVEQLVDHITALYMQELGNEPQGSPKLNRDNIFKEIAKRVSEITTVKGEPDPKAPVFESGAGGESKRGKKVDEEEDKDLPPGSEASNKAELDDYIKTKAGKKAKVM